MAPLPTALRAFFGRHPPPPGAPLVLAVSGGPDSLAMLHALCALRTELGLELHVAHLDHTLRGEQSAAEAAFVAQATHAWGVPATLGAADVRALARARRANLQAAARLARYTFLADVARQTGAWAVATAHHADDQAETVLAHLLRGAGPAGLSGMRPVTALGVALAEAGAPPVGAETPGAGQRATELIRPLLAVTRATIEAYCAEHGLDPRRDPSNHSQRYTRTRIRGRLLPALIEYNPRIVESLCRTAEACAAEHELVEAALDVAWPGLAGAEGAALAFGGPAWAALAPGLRGAAIRRAHALLTAETLGQADLERALGVAGGAVGRRAELPGGVWLTAGYGGSFHVSGGAPPAAGPQLAGPSAELCVPGALALANGWRLQAEHARAAPPRDRWEVFLDPAAAPLLVRWRVAGDRVRPAGGRGSRLLQDLLVDARVPRALRDRWPLVVTGDAAPGSAIAWVPGVRAAAGVLAAPGAPAVRLWVSAPDSAGEDAR